MEGLKYLPEEWKSFFVLAIQEEGENQGRCQVESRRRLFFAGKNNLIPQPHEKKLENGQQSVKLEKEEG
jgi:hypothetical protein